MVWVGEEGWGVGVLLLARAEEWESGLAGGGWVRNEERMTAGSL